MASAAGTGHTAPGLRVRSVQTRRMIVGNRTGMSRALVGGDRVAVARARIWCRRWGSSFAAVHSLPRG